MQLAVIFAGDLDINTLNDLFLRINLVMSVQGTDLLR